MIHLDGATIAIQNERATLEDKLDLETAIDTLLEEGNTTIYLDLSQPLYLPSELMGLLMWKKKLLLEQGKNIIISHINSNLREVFENALLIEYFEID